MLEDRVEALAEQIDGVVFDKLAARDRLFVTTEDGTGLVHQAPAYGEDDFRVCTAAGIALADPLDENCRFTGRVPEHAGTFCKDADKAIIRQLKEAGKLVHQTTLVHSYPFCERTDTPLIQRAIEAWYVRVEDVRDRLAAANAAIRWMPGYVGEKRFGNWLREAKDWKTVGSANMAFHAAIVALSDSERLSAMYEDIAAELRLAFGLLDDPEYLHAPYVDHNARLLQMFMEGQTVAAARELETYLVQSERMVLAVYARQIS
jgi:hypothetical protein